MIEIAPPEVKTDMTAAFVEGGAIVITTEELLKQSFSSLKSGRIKIRTGQTKQLALMQRIAPNFINRQLWKASKKLVPGSVT